MKRLLLVGAGHAHAQVLKDWMAAPVAGTELWVVSPSPLAPYSGMVPGWLAGHYRFGDICIDFAALSAAAGARWLSDEVVGLDADRRQLALRSGLALDYDLLSLNVGSTLTPPPVVGARVLPLRPLGRLRATWEAALAELSAAPADRPLTVTAIGGGAAGVEALFAVRHRLLQLQPRRAVHGGLVSRSAALLPDMAPGAERYVRRALAAAGMTVQLGCRYGPTIAAASDLLLWATGAEAAAWQHGCGLALSAGGYLRVDSGLRSVSHANVHAVGDCAAWADPLPKAGVYAVRMGPVLSHNLRAALGGGSPVRYQPQRRFLALLATGDRRAIASWGRFSAEGAWVWRWKDHIDRSFLRRFDASLPPTQRAERPQPTPKDPA